MHELRQYKNKSITTGYTIFSQAQIQRTTATAAAMASRHRQPSERCRAKRRTETARDGCAIPMLTQYFHIQCAGCCSVKWNVRHRRNETKRIAQTENGETISKNRSKQKIVCLLNLILHSPIYFVSWRLSSYHNIDEFKVLSRPCRFLHTSCLGVYWLVLSKSNDDWAMNQSKKWRFCFYICLLRREHWTRCFYFSFVFRHHIL